MSEAATEGMDEFLPVNRDPNRPSVIPAGYGDRDRLNARIARQADALRFVLARIPEDHRYDEMRRVINGALGGVSDAS